MLINSLSLKNYRGFQNFLLPGLSRINLIVGRNNSGKTSVLEAVQLLGSGGDVRILNRIARLRGEVLQDTEDRESTRSTYPDISHLFYGHSFGADSSFVIEADNELGRLELSVIAAMEPEENQKLLFDETDTIRYTYGLSIRAAGDYFISSRSLPAIPVTEEGALSVDFALRYPRVPRAKSENLVVQFVTQDSLERLPMAELWDRVIAEGKEEEVVSAMRILEPKLNGIFFLTGQRSYRFEPRGGILVGLEGTQRRVPLGSYGEGMRRLLALSLSLVRAQNGILLVDEIDTGLHYGIMGDMWLLVARAAKRYNIQVFATTHSFDCIRGLNWLCQHHPELGKDVSLQKVDPDLPEAVGLNAEQIKITVEQDIEVR